MAVNNTTQTVPANGAKIPEFSGFLDAYLVRKSQFKYGNPSIKTSINKTTKDKIPITTDDRKRYKKKVSFICLVFLELVFFEVNIYSYTCLNLDIITLPMMFIIKVRTKSNNPTAKIVPYSTEP